MCVKEMDYEKKNAKGGDSQTRRVWKQGGSLAIILPAAFTRAHRIEDGDDIAIVANHILRVIPIPESREAASASDRSRG